MLPCVSALPIFQFGEESPNYAPIRTMDIQRGALIFSPSIRIKLAPFCTRYYFLIFNIKNKQTNKLLYIQYNKKVSWAKKWKRGRFERNIAGIGFLFARTMFLISEGSETNIRSSRYFLPVAFFYDFSITKAKKITLV